MNNSWLLFAKLGFAVALLLLRLVQAANAAFAVSRGSSPSLLLISPRQQKQQQQQQQHLPQTHQPKAMMQLAFLQTPPPNAGRCYSTRLSMAAAEAASSSSIGFFGHSGLLLASIVLVRSLYAVIPATRTLKQQQQQEQAGILDRCPWPFIVFHDIKQFFKDSPTWIVLCWIVLWRIIKILIVRRSIAN